MLISILLSIIQAATEFLPISSSGHLALFSNLFSEPNLLLFTFLHLASLLAVLVFTRNELLDLLSFKRKYRDMWGFLFVALIPVLVFVLLGLKSLIDQSVTSFLFLGIAFLFTGIILILTRFTNEKKELDYKSSFFIGLLQVLALFPGISRSGMTISAGLFSGVKKEKSIKFSFLLFIPLSLAAFILEFSEIGFSMDFLSLELLVSFIVCFFFSVLFLNLLYKVLRANKFWVFGFYCFFVGIISLIIHFFV